tara:strand:- start:436 stop:1068 length:633 start_codon:yes stop_codon:yes gene_type:complete
MNTKVLALLSVFMLIFSLVVFFNRNVEGFDQIEDSYDCIDQQIPSKCRLLHSFWKDYNSNYKDSYNSALTELSKCSVGNVDTEAMNKVYNLLKLLNLDNASDENIFSCDLWRSKLDPANNNTKDPTLIDQVNSLETELLNLITEGRYISDANLIDDINMDEAKGFLAAYCAKKDANANKYSSADVIRALWCKLSCGRPRNELEDLNAERY